MLSSLGINNWETRHTYFLFVANASARNCQMTQSFNAFTFVNAIVSCEIIDIFRGLVVSLR